MLNEHDLNLTLPSEVDTIASKMNIIKEYPQVLLYVLGWYCGDRYDYIAGPSTLKKFGLSMLR